MTVGEDAIRRINHEAYLDETWTKEFARADGLIPAERAIVDTLKQTIQGGKILDLGVGGGRTTMPLMEISRDYIGVDFSSMMIAACQQRYPQVRFMVGDAADLGWLADAEFDLVFFS